jgi:hypothetical protein
VSALASFNVSGEVDVDLGIALLPNPVPGRDFDSVSCDDDTLSVPSLTARSMSSGDSSLSGLVISYRSFDTDSAEDSFMPRRSQRHKCASHVQPMDWEFLDDASLSILGNESDNLTKSLTVESEFDMSTCWQSDRAFLHNSCSFSADDVSMGSISSGEDSVASAETILTFTTAASQELFHATPTTNMMDAVDDATIGKKAVKADDAEVPVYLWDMRIRGANPEARKSIALNGFRAFGLQLFRRALYLDCRERLISRFGANWSALPRRKPSGRFTSVGKEVDAISNILWHANEANWFEYLSGSRLHYFRFPIRYRRAARDGEEIRFETEGPATKQRQPEISDPAVREVVRSKIKKVINRRYMISTTEEFLKSLIKYFNVPKGEKDVRIVYDATASGLNDAEWAPPFWLPTIDSLVRALDPNAWMTDRDIGDMFLNFPLHESAWPFAGLDIQPILTEEEVSLKRKRWYHWVRNAMGFSPSPYNSIKMALVAEEVIRGDRFDLSNPFQWKIVKLNLPGTENYDPTGSWIIKMHEDGLIACELFTFVDDERVSGPTEELTWQAAHVMAARQAYLGIHDAARKAGKCSQQPRAWAGAVVHVDEDKGVCVLTSEEKWAKMKGIVLKWSDRLKSGVNELNHKELLSERGFMVYVTRAYPPLIPYMKGFHLTAEMWRGNRDAEGWKLPPKLAATQTEATTAGLVLDQDEDEAAVRHFIRHQLGVETPYAPATGTTTPAPRFIDDLKALTMLTSSNLPPLCVVRPKRVVHVFYGFGDASGKGRGSTFQGFKTVTHPAEDPALSLIYKVGVWGADVESESSNYRLTLATANKNTAIGGNSSAIIFLYYSYVERGFLMGS